MDSWLEKNKKMNNLDFIDYSNYFNKSINAFQVLSDLEGKKNNLNEYRDTIINKLSIDKANIAIPCQVHSNNVQFVRSCGIFENTDGLITDCNDIILCLQTADCLPIFLFDKLNHSKGLVHSGWRGTKDKIIQRALDIMFKRGSIASNIVVVIGAAIQKCCYQIGDELIPFFDKSCIYSKNNKKYLSLQEQILIDLSKLNIPFDNIYIDGKCTFTDTNLSSYRRDKDKAGRMLSFFGEF